MRGIEKVVNITVLCALLLGTVFSASIFNFDIKKAHAADTTVHLNTNGDNSACGSSLTNTTIGGTGITTYVLDNDMICSNTAANGLLINYANGITINGNGHTITGTGLLANATKAGIRVDGATISFTIENFGGISNFNQGIRVYGNASPSSAHGRIQSNIITGNAAGVYWTAVSYVDVTGNNTLTSNGNGIVVTGASHDNTISGNNLNSNTTSSIWLQTGSSGNTISGNTANSNGTGGIMLTSSSGNTISGNTTSNTANSGSGINLDSSSGNTLSGNTSNSNYYGVYLNASNNNTLTGNTINSNNIGIRSVASTGTIATNTELNRDTYAISLASNSIATFNNCTINYSSHALALTSNGDAATLKNCIVSNNITEPFVFGSSGGSITTDHSLIQALSGLPNSFTTGTGTWNTIPADTKWHGAATDQNDPFPYYARTKENTGFISLSTDDRGNIDYFKEVADYAMANYDIPMTLFVNETESLNDNSPTSNTDKAKLQALYNQGDDIGVHTRHHTNLAKTSPFSVTYSGAGANPAVVVTGLGTSFSVTGTTGNDHTVDLANAAYDTVGELCTAIDGWNNFDCTPDSETSMTVLANSLKDTTTLLSGLTTIPYDDATDSTNRFYTEEITNSVGDLTTAIRSVDPAVCSSCAAYEPTSFAFPYNKSSDAVLTWIRVNATNLTFARAATPNFSTDLTSIHLYGVTAQIGISAADGASINSADVQRSAALAASWASTGKFIALLSHNNNDLSSSLFKQFIDDLVQYRSYIQINSFPYFADKLRNNENGWSYNAGTGIATRTFTGSDDLRLTNNSSAINAGTAIVGRTTDILGNSLVGTPDIGAYEFQAPTAPANLTQFKTDGITAISSGGWTNQSTAVLKFSASSTNVYDSFTPGVEVQPNGTAFTDTATNSGTAVAYSGTPVTGSVTMTGLVDGPYHWQALSTNSAIASSWTSSGGSPDFKVDTSPPVLNVNSPANNYSTTASSVIITGGASDVSPGSGVNTVTINGISISNPTSFSATATLAVGTNTFTIVATDLAGNTTSQTLTITRTLPITAAIIDTDDSTSSTIARPVQTLTLPATITDNTDTTTFYSAIIDSNNNNGQTTLEPATTPTFYTQYPKLKGKTYANATVVIEIDSGLITAEVTSDAEGYWEYTPTKVLDFGVHTVKITIKEKGTSNILSTDEYKFNIVEKAKETVAPESQTDKKSDAWLFWILGIVSVIIFVGVGYKVSKKN